MRRVAAILALALLGLLLVACEGEEELPTPAGGQLAERWLRAGEDNNAGVAVYERALPPYLVDLLNPQRTADTPEDDLLAFPVHPEGELLGSYILRRADGSHIAWLFYDVPESTTSAVIDTVTDQLNGGPWQVLLESGTRSNRLIRFENTRNTDITGNAITEGIPGSADFTIVVEREGEEVTLTVPRTAPVPLVEARFSANLVVQEAYPGHARSAGLREGDRVLRVGETDVSSERDLQRALEDMAAGPRTVSLLYVLQFAPPQQAAMPPFVPVGGLSLPADFPLRDSWAQYDLDRFESSRGAAGRNYFAAMFSPDSPTVVANEVRDALEAGGWEIVTDEAQGFGTRLEFQHPGQNLIGVAAIDESPLDEALTQVLVQMQNAPPAGS